MIHFWYLVHFNVILDAENLTKKIQFQITRIYKLSKLPALDTFGEKNHICLICKKFLHLKYEKLRFCDIFKCSKECLIHLKSNHAVVVLSQKKEIALIRSTFNLCRRTLLILKTRKNCHLNIAIHRRTIKRLLQLIFKLALRTRFDSEIRTHEIQQIWKGRSHLFTLSRRMSCVHTCAHNSLAL